LSDNRIIHETTINQCYLLLIDCDHSSISHAMSASDQSINPPAQAAIQQVMSPVAQGNEKINSSLTIPKLMAKKPFRIFSLQINSYLRQVNLHHVIADIDDDKAVTYGDDHAVFAILVQALTIDTKDKYMNSDYLDLIADCGTSGRQAWKILNDHFTKRNFVDCISLLKKLINSTFDSRSDLKKHINNFKTLASDIEAADQDLKLGQKLLSVMLLMSLPAEYDAVVSALGTMPNLTVDSMISYLLSHESRMKDKQTSMVMVSKEKTRGNFKRQIDNSGSGGYPKQSTDANKKIKGKFPDQYCTFCKCYGHGTSYCFRKKGTG
jgi:hypothetical protein